MTNSSDVTGVPMQLPGGNTSRDIGDIARLRARVQELEDTLAAIRSGAIDAVLVSGPAGERIYTLQGSEHLYRVLVEAMNEGAATLSREGRVLYANPRFAQMAGVSLEQLIGRPLDGLVECAAYTSLQDVFREAQHNAIKLECEWCGDQNRKVPVYLSLSPLREEEFEGISVVATDLTAVKNKEKELAATNEKLRVEVAQRMIAEEALRQDEESLRQLSGRLLQLQDEERRRIARDLHDSTGQKLVALTLDLSVLRDEVPAKSQEAFSECFKIAQEVSNEVRTLSYLLHPPLLDEVGLACAVKWYVDGFTRRSNIAVELQMSPDLPRLRPELEIAIFRILQETLTNVHRHSGSRTAKVKLTLKHDEIILEVADHGRSGKGSNLSRDAGGALGVGIRGMKERVRQLGGSLKLSSNQEGTIVNATLPAHFHSTGGAKTPDRNSENRPQSEHPHPGELDQATR